MPRRRGLKAICRFARFASRKLFLPNRLPDRASGTRDQMLLSPRPLPPVSRRERRRLSQRERKRSRQWDRAHHGDSSYHSAAGDAVASEDAERRRARPDADRNCPLVDLPCKRAVFRDVGPQLEVLHTRQVAGSKPAAPFLGLFGRCPAIQARRLRSPRRPRLRWKRPDHKFAKRLLVFQASV